MSDLRDLYQQMILDHNQKPRNFGKVEDHSHHASGENSLCGDHLELTLLVEDDVIRDIKFDGGGCAISTASASIMTTVIKGKSTPEALQLFDQFHTMITTGEADMDALGKLVVLADVHKYPARVKCAMLPWRTLESSIEGIEKIATTE